MSISDKKKFIILQEDDKGFSFNGKKPSGYTKIEERDSKFKIFYYIQNINSETTCTLSLILKNDSKVEVISIGDIKSDENGKIDISYDFDESILDFVCGSTICIKDSKGDMKFPLSGFLPKKKVYEWKVNQFRLIKNRPFKREVPFYERKKEDEVKKQNEVLNFEDKELQEQIVKGEIEEESIVESPEENNGYESENVYVLTHEDSSCNMREDDEDLYDYDEYEEMIKGIIDTSKEDHNQAKYHADALKKLLKKDKDGIEKIIKGLFPGIFNSNRDINKDYGYRFFLSVLDEYEEIESLDFKDCRMFKVNVGEFSEMENMEKHDNIKYSVVYYPMLSLYPYFKDKGYFLIGIRCDEINEISNLLYCVEAKDGENKNFPYDGKTGFNKYVYDYGTSKGYYVMEYDYKKCLVK